MDRRESFFYDGAGLLADAAGTIHIAGPNGALNQAGWTDQMILSFTDSDADGSQSPVLAARNLYGPAVDQICATEGASGSLLWSLSDHQGTLRDWVTRSTQTHFLRKCHRALDFVQNHFFVQWHKSNPFSPCLPHCGLRKTNAMDLIKQELDAVRLSVQ